MKFLTVSQNSDLSLKLESTCQNEFRGMFDFQNRAPEAYKQKLHVKRCNKVTSKNVLFNYSSFGKYENTTRFVASKRV